MIATNVILTLDLTLLTALKILNRTQLPQQKVPREKYRQINRQILKNAKNAISVIEAVGPAGGEKVDGNGTRHQSSVKVFSETGQVADDAGNHQHDESAGYVQNPGDMDVRVVDVLQVEVNWSGQVQAKGYQI